MTDPKTQRRFPWELAIGGGVAVAAACGLLAALDSGPAAEPPRPVAATAAPLAEATDPAAPVPMPSEPRVSDLAIESGETVEVEAGSLSGDEPLVLRLALAEPAVGSEELPVRVLAPDGRALEAAAGVAEGSAHIAIEPGWLSPGRYIVELRTTERSHFPLRRYALVVK